MEDVNYGAPPDYKVAGRVGDYGADRGDAARDGYGIKLGTQEDTNTPWIEGDLHSPLLTDNIENTSASQRKLVRDSLRRSWPQTRREKTTESGTDETAGVLLFETVILRSPVISRNLREIF